MRREYTYVIADLSVAVTLDVSVAEDIAELLPSFRPFVADSTDRYPHVLSVHVEDGVCDGDAPTACTDHDGIQHVSVFETGNGDIDVARLSDGGYRYVIYDISNVLCAVLTSNRDSSVYRCVLRAKALQQRSFGLNNAMMIAYAFAGCRYGALLVHASVVKHDGMGYAFIAKSGTGKSTQTGNWLRTIDNCELLNDDNPVVRAVDGSVMVYGSPWSGKTPCYKQDKALLGAVSLICRDATNWMEPVSGIAAFADLLTSCSVLRCDKPIYTKTCEVINRVVQTVPMYHLHCTAEPESAIVCYDAVRPNGANS